MSSNNYIKILFFVTNHRRHGMALIPPACAVFKVLFSDKLL